MPAVSLSNGVGNASCNANIFVCVAAFKIGDFKNSLGEST
jgi:hypothetical protein